jgi:hypothetical protein
MTKTFGITSIEPLLLHLGRHNISKLYNIDTIPLSDVWDFDFRSL